MIKKFMYSICFLSFLFSGLSADWFFHLCTRDGVVERVDYYETYVDCGDRTFVIDSEDWMVGDSVRVTYFDNYTLKFDDDEVVRVRYMA